MLRDEEKESGMAQAVSPLEEQREKPAAGTNGQEVFDIAMDPYNHMMRVLFGRWKPFILRAISIDDGTYFSRFFKQLPISQKVLSQNLKEMQEDDLIYRIVLPEVPPRVVYKLTETGQMMIGVLDLVYDWGWKDMKRKGLPVDILGEMWHGYREPEPELMDRPFYTGVKE